MTKSKMPIELALKLLHELVKESLLAPELVVVWHSGEPLTLPPSYYAEAIEAITNYCRDEAPTVSVSFDIQTNATLINDEWCDFFEKYSSILNLGVSCDGPEELHDLFRLDRKGRSTFESTLRGMNKLDQRGLVYNVIAVVTRRTLLSPVAFIDFFYQRRQSLTDFHFNILASPLPGVSGGDLGYSVEDRKLFSQFYSQLLEFWQSKNSDEDEFSIRNFSQTFERLSMCDLPDAPSHVVETSAPLRSLNMDSNGNITTFYAGLDIGTEVNRYGDGEGLGLGNIKQKSLADMLRSAKLATMAKDFERSHELCASSCEYYSVCPGGFELIQWSSQGSAKDVTETVECIIHVKALTDAVLDNIDQQARYEDAELA